MRVLIFTMTLGVLFFATAPSQATLIASDSFHTTDDPYVADTYAVNRLMTQNRPIGAYGFSTAWTTAWNNTGDLAAKTGGLTHNMVGNEMPGYAYSTTGINARSVFRKVDHSISGISATGESDYHFSFLMATQNGQRIAGMGLRGPLNWPSFGAPTSQPAPYGSNNYMDALSRLDNPDLGGVSVGFELTGLAVWVNGIKTSIPGVSITPGDAYFTLVHVANNGVGNNDVINVSIYDPSATLNDLGSPFAFISIADQDVTGNMYNLAVQKLSAAEGGDGLNGETYFDEFRFGTSLESVIVPEPASVALLGLGGLMLARRRRQ